MKNHKLFILLIVIFSASCIFSQITKYTLEPTGLNDVYGFGRSVAEYGEYAAIGAPGTHSNGIYNQGAVMVYRQNDVGDWTLVQMMFPSDSIEGNGFGYRVAMSNEFILATCSGSDSDHSLYIFKQNNSNIWEEYEILTNAPLEPEAIDISGNYAIIGGFYGRASMFHYNGTNWVRQQILTQDLDMELSVSIDGDYAVVGAWRQNNYTGIALVYRRVGQVWQIQDTLIASDAHFDDHFGNSVSIDGNYIAVGAKRRNDGIGGAYIFKRDGSNWVEEAILTNSQIGADFGSSVSIKENYVVVTATFVGGISYLCIFNKVLNDWNLIYSDQVYGVFGYQTAISNNFILSGYHWLGQYNKVYIYEGLNIVSVESNKNMQVKSFAIHQNYPNPFNPSTTIIYQIPELSFVTIKIFDLLGSEIATLVSEEKPIGSYEIDFNATGLPSSIYFYRIQAGDFIQTKKMILIK